MLPDSVKTLARSLHPSHWNVAYNFEHTEGLCFVVEINSLQFYDHHRHRRRQTGLLTVE